MKITEDTPTYAAKEGITEEEAWKNGREEQNIEFVENGAVTKI